MKNIMESLSNLERDNSIVARMLYITPAAASELLQRNTHNRKISASVVSKYIIENQLGEWRKSSAGVGFDDNGVLIDGQHRLKMIVDSKLAAWLLIVIGLPKQSQEKIDRQRRRTLYDVLQLSGEAWSKDAVQIATAIVRSRTDFQKSVCADAEVKAALENHKCAIVKCEELLKSAQASKGLCRAAVKAALVLSLEKNESKTVTFIKALVSGENMRLDDPPLRLRRWLVEGAKACTHGNRGQRDDYGRTVYALNAFMSGRTIDRLLHNSELE